MKPKHRNRTRPVFTCAVCGEVVSLGELAKSCVRKSGAQSKLAAVLTLLPEDIVCRFCAETDDELEGLSLTGERLGRSEVERWNLSGLTIDPAISTVLMLNY
jgi:hypothetical protein